MLLLEMKEIRADTREAVLKANKERDEAVKARNNAIVKLRDNAFQSGMVRGFLISV